MKDRVAIAVAAFAGVLHLATANRYDVFRDELYFIVCGRHPAFGYADQPPLVPLVAAGLYALGAQTWLLRLPAILAAAGLAALTVAFVRLLGGRDGAAWIAGIAVATAPMLMGLTSTLNTTACEPFCWTAVAYLLARGILRDEGRSLVWAGVVAGVTMEVKYALPLWLGALAIGLLLTPERRVFARPQLWIGIALATALALPSVIWQALHGFPFVELVHNAHLKDAPVSPLGFAANQVLVMSPLFAPIWLAGIAAPFAFRDLRPARFLSVAFAICAVAIVASQGKDYYLTPAYPPLFALGAIAIERLVRNAYVRVAYLGAALVLSAAIAPLALPILSPPALLAYERSIHVTANAQERADVGNAMPSLYWTTTVKRPRSTSTGARITCPPRSRDTTNIFFGACAASIPSTSCGSRATFPACAPTAPRCNCSASRDPLTLVPSKTARRSRFATACTRNCRRCGRWKKCLSEMARVVRFNLKP